MQTCRHADMQTCRHADMHTCIHAYMHTCIHAYMHTCIHTYRQTDRQTDIQTYTHTHIHTNSICIKISLAPKIVPHHSQEAGGAPEVIRHFRVWILRKSMGPWQWDIHPVENVVLLNFIGGQIRGNPLPPGNSTVCYGTSPFFMGKWTINCNFSIVMWNCQVLEM